MNFRCCQDKCQMLLTVLIVVSCVSPWQNAYAAHIGGDVHGAKGVMRREMGTEELWHVDSYGRFSVLDDMGHGGLLDIDHPVMNASRPPRSYADLSGRACWTVESSTSYSFKAHALEDVKNRMQYWRWPLEDGSQAQTEVSSPEEKPADETKYLLFDYDQGGLNNIRLGWEVAGLLAYQTGRTLVFPPRKEFYLIDAAVGIGEGETHKSGVDDFLNMDILKQGLKFVSFSEFRAQEGTAMGLPEHVSDAELLSGWGVKDWPTTPNKRFSGESDVYCDLASYEDPARTVYVAQDSQSQQGRIFSCSEWFKLGNISFKHGGKEWTPRPGAQSLVRDHFVWHDDIYELAAPIIASLGMFQYNALHARYNDFQFHEFQEPGAAIADRWFLAENVSSLLGKRILYVATDETGKIIGPFHDKGVAVMWSDDFFNDPKSPIAGLIHEKSDARMRQLKGPVEQLVCAFGRVFVGTRDSTFSGYIQAMRGYADAPQRGPPEDDLLYHSDELSNATVAKVLAQMTTWDARNGAETPVRKDILVHGSESLIAVDNYDALGPSPPTRALSVYPVSQVMIEEGTVHEVSSHKPISLQSSYLQAAIDHSSFNPPHHFDAVGVHTLGHFPYAIPTADKQEEHREESFSSPSDKWRIVQLTLGMIAVPLMLFAAKSENAGVVMVGLCYSAVSVAMNVLNKEAARSFKGTCLLVIIQMVITDVMILSMEFRKLTTSEWQWRDVAKWSIVPVAFAGMLLTSMFAFREATLCTILIIRNVLPIFTIVAEKALFGTPKDMSSYLVLSLLITFAGSVLYGVADISATRFGKILILVNCLFTVMDRLVQTQLLRNDSSFSLSLPFCALLNNSMSIAPLLGIAFATGEVAEWGHVISGATRTAWFWVIMSSICGTCLSYVGLRVQTLVSGTSVLVLQNFNKIIIICLGMSVYKESMTLTSSVAMIISMAGCIWYGYLRIPVKK